MSALLIENAEGIFTGLPGEAMRAQGSIRIRDGVITLEHMYFADEIRPTTDVVPKKLPRVEKRELDMAETLIERFTSSFDHERYEDEYRKKLLKIVRQKQKGKEIHVEELEEREAPTDILEALKASVEAAKGTRNGKSRAKKAPARTKRKAKAKT